MSVSERNKIRDCKRAWRKLVEWEPDFLDGLARLPYSPLPTVSAKILNDIWERVHEHAYDAGNRTTLGLGTRQSENGFSKKRL